MPATWSRRGAVCGLDASTATTARRVEQQAQAVPPQHGETGAEMSDDLEPEQLVELGEVRPDIDPELAAVAVAGAVVYRRLMTAQPLSADEVEPLIHTVLG